MLLQKMMIESQLNAAQEKAGQDPPPAESDKKFQEQGADREGVDEPTVPPVDSYVVFSQPPVGSLPAIKQHHTRDGHSTEVLTPESGHTSKRWVDKKI